VTSALSITYFSKCPTRLHIENLHNAQIFRVNKVRMSCIAADVSNNVE